MTSNVYLNRIFPYDSSYIFKSDSFYGIKIMRYGRFKHNSLHVHSANFFIFPNNYELYVEDIINYGVGDSNWIQFKEINLHDLTSKNISGEEFYNVDNNENFQKLYLTERLMLSTDDSKYILSESFIEKKNAYQLFLRDRINDKVLFTCYTPKLSTNSVLMNYIWYLPDLTTLIVPDSSGLKLHNIKTNEIKYLDLKKQLSETISNVELMNLNRNLLITTSTNCYIYDIENIDKVSIIPTPEIYHKVYSSASKSIIYISGLQKSIYTPFYSEIDYTVKYDYIKKITDTIFNLRIESFQKSKNKILAKISDENVVVNEELQEIYKTNKCTKECKFKLTDNPCFLCIYYEDSYCKYYNNNPTNFNIFNLNQINFVKNILPKDIILNVDKNTQNISTYNNNILLPRNSKIFCYNNDVLNNELSILNHVLDNNKNKVIYNKDVYDNKYNLVNGNIILYDIITHNFDTLLRYKNDDYFYIQFVENDSNKIVLIYTDSNKKDKANVQLLDENGNVIDKISTNLFLGEILKKDSKLLYDESTTVQQYYNKNLILVRTGGLFENEKHLYSTISNMLDTFKINLTSNTIIANPTDGTKFIVIDKYNYSNEFDYGAGTLYFVKNLKSGFKLSDYKYYNYYSYSNNLILYNIKMFIDNYDNNYYEKYISEIHLYDFLKEKLIFKYISREIEFKYSAIAHSEKYFAIVDSRNNIYFKQFDIKNDISYEFSCDRFNYIFLDSTKQFSSIIDIKFSNDDKRIFVSYEDGSVKIYNIIYDSDDNLISIEEQLRFVNLDDGDYIAITPDNYYKASKNALTKFGFKLNNKAYTASQFDLKYNRPDIVLTRMGNTDSSLIKALHLAYLKRLKQNGILEAELDNLAAMPEVSIQNKHQLPQITKNNMVELKLIASCSSGSLAHVNIAINGVRVVQDKLKINTKQIEKTYSIPLSEGRNEIQVNCMNSNSIKSLNDRITVTFNPTNPQAPKVYFIGIGINNFKDQSWNLTYAAKDIRDLSNVFKTQYGNNLRIDTFIDQEATLANLLKIKGILAKTSIEDKLIVAISTHGIVDDSLNYYLATYDMNFSNPSSRGLSYEALENMFSDIPIRKKLLFLDACNSGEIDKEENMVAQLENIRVNEVKGAKVLVSKKNTLGLQNSFELMQQHFSNLQNDNGVAVISAASGKQFAYESKDWNNGVFSYSLLNGLKNKQADLDGNGTISISELREYVSREVEKLTQGKQTPTSRKENMEQDWDIWK